ncbi:MAG: FtsQ-type POTRA domain-containing protein [Anaerovoracaceae bacterium]
MGNRDTIEVPIYEAPTEMMETEPPQEEAPKEKPKKRKKKKRRKKHYFLRFLVFCGIVAGSIAFLSSSYFDVKTIEVTGNVNYNQEEVIALSGLETGGNIFKLPRKEAMKNLLKDSYIEKAKVKRKFPKTVVLNVTERKEMAAIPYGEEYIIIDSKGYVLNKVAEEPKLTQLLGLTIKEMKKGQVIEVKENNVLENTLDMLQAIEYSDLFFKKIDMTNVVIRAYLYDQLICKGTPQNILENIKNGNMEGILYDLYKKQITKGVVNVGDDQYCSYSPNIE